MNSVLITLNEKVLRGDANTACWL